MLGLFRKKETTGELPAEEIEYPAAPGTQIRYSPNLITDLTAEHRQLVGLYQEIQAAFEEAHYSDVSALLARLRDILQEHLLTENIRLYIYLERNFPKDDTQGQLIREFRREMDGIGRSAMKFLDKYEAIGIDRDLAGAFESDFAALGQILTRRIEREETALYPLYAPMY